MASAMNDLRSHLAKQQDASESQVVAIMFLCLAAIYTEDLTALRQHHASLRFSVAKKGGLNSLQYNGAAFFARTMELYCCTIFFEQPQVPQLPLLESLRLPIFHISGSAWQSASILAHLDHKVVKNCHEASALANILTHVLREGPSMDQYMYIVQQ